jgi:pyruvate decarboxylase
MSSIGYSVGAVLGAALAARELPDGAERRVILFVGEGSLQLTVQALNSYNLPSYQYRKSVP